MATTPFAHPRDSRTVLSDSSVFAELKREMQETGTDLESLLQDVKSDDSSNGELERKREAESTGQSVKGLLDDVQQRADANDRDVTEQLKREFNSFTN